MAIDHPQCPPYLLCYIIALCGRRGRRRRLVIHIEGRKRETKSTMMAIPPQ